MKPRANVGVSLDQCVPVCVCVCVCVCVWTVVSLLFPFCLFCFSLVWSPDLKHPLQLSHFQPISSALVIQASFPHTPRNNSFTNIGLLSLIANTIQQTHFCFHEIAASYHQAIFHISYQPTTLRLDIPLCFKLIVM